MTTPLIHMLPSRIAQIGRLVKERRTELGLSQSEFAERISEQLGRRVDFSRIAKIELSSQESVQTGQSTGYAKGLKQDEVAALAKLLQLPVALLNGNSEHGGVIFDPMIEPDRTQEVINLLNLADRDSEELLGWAEFLPCSLETPEFMEAHHSGVFQEIASDSRFFQAVTRHYNGLGSHRRQRLLNSASRPWRFVQLILQSDLYRIVRGEGHEYSVIPPQLRRECLRELRRLIAEEQMKIDLIVSDADRPPWWSNGLDSLVVFDQKLAFWRQCNGSFFWTTDRRLIQVRRDWLNDFRQTARYDKRADILSMLLSMCEMVI